MGREISDRKSGTALESAAHHALESRKIFLHTSSSSSKYILFLLLGFQTYSNELQLKVLSEEQGVEHLFKHLQDFPDNTYSILILFKLENNLCTKLTVNWVKVVLKGEVLGVDCLIQMTMAFFIPMTQTMTTLR
ncbi:hypothetical protein HN51_014499 [Arachis hypogaea]